MKHVLNIATVTAANLRRRIMEVYPSLYAAFESMDVRDRAFTGRGEDVEGVFRS